MYPILDAAHASEQSVLAPDSILRCSRPRGCPRSVPSIQLSERTSWLRLRSCTNLIAASSTRPARLPVPVLNLSQESLQILTPIKPISVHRMPCSSDLPDPVPVSQCRCRDTKKLRRLGDGPEVADSNWFRAGFGHGTLRQAKQPGGSLWSALKSVKHCQTLQASFPFPAR